MKTTSLRKLLCSYGSAMSCASIMSLGVLLPIHNLICTKTNNYIGNGLTVLIFAIIMNIGATKMRKSLIKAYNEKLSHDAYELASQLKGEKNVETDVLTELLEEVRDNPYENEI